jgi:hypothetical protein
VIPMCRRSEAHKSSIIFDGGKMYYQRPGQAHARRTPHAARRLITFLVAQCAPRFILARENSVPE